MNQDIFSDDTLMTKFCAGDTQAFQLLYARHEKPLYRYLRRILGRESTQADDVFQDTWMKLIDVRARWREREDASFKTWLFMLAHHRAVDVMRKSGREVSADEGWLDDESDGAWQLLPAPTSEQPEQLTFWRKAGQQLLDCLDGLPTLQRAAFLLHHDEGLSLDEISRVLNAEFETVKSRLRYAMSKLKACMGAYMQPILQSEPETTR